MDTTKQKLENSLKEAMRNNDAVRKTTVRLVLANLKLAEIERGAVLDEPAILSLVQKEIKVRQEAIEDAQKTNRTDLITKAQAEIRVLEEFLPKQLSDSELRLLVEESIAEVGASSPADMGKVMKAVLPKLQGRAPGDLVSRVVRDLLQKAG